MFGFGGIAIVFVCVFGGYIVAGGKIGVILRALPLEMVIIGGAAIGSFLISNGSSVIKTTLKDFGRIFSGPKYKRQDYVDVLCLMFNFLKLAKTRGALALESHIEKPAESNLFGQFPRVSSNHFAIELICDSARILTMGMDKSHEFEDLLNKELDKHHHEIMRSAGALQSMSDALPALGIVAAVLGVIKTMASISEPPEILGAMIGSALVGTFLGVLLSYGLVGPFASRLKQVYEDEHRFYEIIRDTLVAHMAGNAPQISVEIGRKSVPTELQPTFYELEEAIAATPPVAS